MVQLQASMFVTEQAALPLDAVLEEIVSEGIGEEHVSMLFGLLRKNLRKAAVHCARGELDERTAAAHAAIDVLVFMRRNLKADRENPFNGALDRFYLAVHRRIADACRDENDIGFLDLEAAIDKLAASRLSKTFIDRCLEQSVIEPRAFKAFLTDVITRCEAVATTERATASGR